MKKHIPLILVPLFAFLCAKAQSESIYTVRDLGVQHQVAFGAEINNSGDVLMGTEADPSSSQITAYFFHGSALTDLSSTFTASVALGNTGTLIGTQYHGGSEAEVYRYTPPPLTGPPNAQITQLTGAYSNVTAVNAQGSVTGWQGDVSTPHAFLSLVSGELTDLGTLGGNASYAQGINDSNQVVGMSLTGAMPLEIAAGATEAEAFVYSNGSMKGIGTLGGQTSVAQSINNAGQVVGDSSLPNQESHAFVYDQIDGMQDIGRPGINSSARDINNLGVVVGNEYDPLGSIPSKAFLFDSVNGIRFIGDLVGPQTGWTSFLTATSINDFGQVVGTGIIQGEVHVFLATPVPEPSAISLLGLFAVIFASRNHRLCVYR